MRRLARPLLYLGAVGAVLLLSKIHAAWVADPPYDYTGSSRFAWSLAYALLLGVTAYGIGLPDVPRSVKGAVASSVGAAVAAAGGMSVLQLVVGDALLPRFVVFGVVLVVVPWYLFCCAIAQAGHRQAAAVDRVVVVSDSSAAGGLADELRAGAERPATLTAVIPLAEVGTISGSQRALVDRVENEQCSVVVLDRPALDDDLVVGQVAELHEHGVRVRTLSLFYEEWLGKLPVSELERVSLMFDIGEVHRVRYGRAKRLVDVVIGSGALVAFVIVVPFVFLGNLVSNRGPLFYRQPRVGKNGVEFRIWKFRTMLPSTETGGAWTANDDPRITPFGRILRVSHLDELPQVLNILAGNLSIVGPRPEQPHYVEQLKQKLPFYDLRHLVRPGLTGWAQVKYGYAGDERDALEKLQYDFYYLRHQSLALDGRIIGRTIRSVLLREGR
jgi:lipopolysaccharide/colanic/teichoic acid biosynthesis glycosyltransferase